MKKLNTLTVDVLYEIYSKYINHHGEKKDFRLVKSYTDEDMAMFQQGFPLSVVEDDEQEEFRYTTRIQIFEGFIWLTRTGAAMIFAINAQMNEDLKALGYEINYDYALQMA